MKVVIHLHETWKIQNQVIYSFTMKVKVKVAQSCLTLWDPHGIYSPWNSPGQNTGVGNLSLLQGIFPNQGSNPGLLHCRQILYQLNHKGSPRILEWVAYPFSSRSSQPRNRTGVSCIASGFFTNYAIREASLYITIIFLIQRFLAGVSISNSPKLIKWIYREVEGYSRPEKHYLHWLLIRKNHIMSTSSWIQGTVGGSFWFDFVFWIWANAKVFVVNVNKLIQAPSARIVSLCVGS